MCDAACACPAELKGKCNALDENPWLLREIAGNQTHQTHINSMERLAILASRIKCAPAATFGKSPFLSRFWPLCRDSWVLGVPGSM